MDRYLASASIQDATALYLNLNFEILRGCQFNCTGCSVNKTAAMQIKPSESLLLERFVGSAKGTGVYKPFIAFIGPTDFLAADNTTAILGDPDWIPVLRMFKRLSLQTTTLNMDRLPGIAAVLKRNYGDLELEINVLIEPEKILNRKYMKTIRENRDRMLEIIGWPTKVRTFALMNVYDYDAAKNPVIAELLNNYEEMDKIVGEIFETTIDFNFSMSRKEPGLTTEEFIASATRVKNLYNEHICERTVPTLRFSFGKLNDCMVERQYTWRNGKFYISPLFYDRYVSFMPGFEIPLEKYTIDEVEQFESKIVTDSYANLGNKEECQDCQLLASCVDRQILHMMDCYGVTECLVSKDAILKVG